MPDYNFFFEPIVTPDDVNKYPFNEGWLYPKIFKILIKYPYSIYIVHNWVKKILVNVGRYYYNYFGMSIESKIFLFFPWNITGGADKVNYEIVNALHSHNPVVIFTDRIDKRKLRGTFQKDIRTINFTKRYIKYLHIFQQYFFAGYISGMIDNATALNEKEIIVLGSNCCLFYEIINNLKQPCRIVDVIHAFIGIEKKSIKLVPKITQRVLITPTLYPQLENQYIDNNYQEYLNRVSIILNGVDIPDTINDKPFNTDLNIIYVGRESPEKRTHLIGSIAKGCKELNLSARFQLIGVTSRAIHSDDLQYCNILGEITDKKELMNIYHNADILLITSSFEGFPMVIMEGMAHGVIPISTDVGGVKDHIINAITGYCVNNSSEEQIVIDFIKRIEYLSLNRNELVEIRFNVFNYAKHHFSIEIFRERYLELVNKLIP